MKQQYKILCIFIFYPLLSYSFIKEMQQLEYSLQSLSNLLSTQQITSNYEVLKKIVNEAYEKKNPNLFDKYEQTIAIQIARYLIQKFIEEGEKPQNRPLYIPLIAYIAEKTTTRYPNKNEYLNCLSLASGNLENEFLLVRALRYIGYKKIRLVTIDPIYKDNKRKANIFTEFKKWCQKLDITVSRHKIDLQDGINLFLLDDAYRYIRSIIIPNKLPKNHLLIMIQPSVSQPVFMDQFTFNQYFRSRSVEYNIIKFAFDDGDNISVFLPYYASDFFIESDNKRNKDKEFKSLKSISDRFIETFLHRKVAVGFKYQTALVDKLAGHAFSEFDNLTWIAVGQNTNLSFFDVIKHTAVDAQNPLAFTSLYWSMQQIIDMSGNMQDIYNIHISAD